MRDFATFENLYKAMAVAAVVTVMSVGRLVQAGVPLVLFIPATFLAMTFIAGAVTAWGRRAGMPGIAFDRATLLPGLAVAAAFLAVALPFYVLGFDPALKRALATAGVKSVVEMSFPSTTGGRIAMLLWSAGFQAMFFVAAPMSFFARLTGRSWIAAGFCVALRTYVVHRQIVYAGLTDQVPLFLLSALFTTLAACILFRRYGLVPVMVFAAGLDLRAFWQP